MNQLTIIVTILIVAMLFALPQRFFLLCFIVTACLIPVDQRVIIFSLDFTPLRFCVLFGFMRILLRGEAIAINWGTFDKLILAWAVCGAVIYVLRWGSIGAMINRSGYLFDCLGLYWIFRQSIRRWRDVYFIVKIFAVMALISAPLIVFERITHNNVFSIFGRASAQFSYGRWRCSGPFPHSIMMGLFWAVLLPLFYACAKSSISRVFYYTAIVAAIICAVLSGSSTPLITVMAIGVFWLIYKYRMYGKQIWIGFLCMLFALHLVMKAPVWHLISRVNIFGGSTGWHRYHLIDKAIAHWDEWLILGCRSTAHWGYGLQDITNQYILEAVRGGFITFVIFIVIIYQAVKITGQYSLQTSNEKAKWLSWGLCVSILGHNVSFFGVSYFGQIILLLYLTFAIVGFIAENALGLVKKPILRQLTV